MRRNQVILDAVVAELSELRYSPAGMPVVTFRLNHRSSQTQAGEERRVDCVIAGQAVGEVAQQMAQLAGGSEVAVQGFLARKSAHSEYPVLHVQRFKLL